MSQTNEVFDTWKGAKLIPAGELVLPEWNVNEMDEPEFAALVEAIKDEGFDEPCQVVPIKAGEFTGKYLVLGGNHRHRAGVISGLDKLPCVIKTALSDKDELELAEWSVKRNNIRGRINKEKYAELERKLTGRWQISAEAAKNRMLIRQEIAKNLKSSKARAETEFGPDEEVDVSAGPPPHGKVKGNSGDFEGPETDGEVDQKKSFADRRALLASLKTFAQDVLSDSEDTAENGYLYFGYGGGTHLVVNESRELNSAVSDMVDVCRANSDNICEFLISAIRKELKQWQ